MSSHVIALSLLFADQSPTVDSVRAMLAYTADKWFDWLLVSSGVVALGCVLEIWETWTSLRRWWFLKYRSIEEPENPTSWNIPIAAIGLVLVIVGVVGEGVFEGLVSNADTALRAHDEQVLGDTIKQAGLAKASADKAAMDALSADTSSDGAVKKSDKADKSASSALTVATGARKDADSLVQSITDAKQKAADAISRLADAEQRLADSTQREAAAEAKLSAIKTPRSLVSTNELVAALKPFKGTEYTFNVFGDEEAMRFMKIVANALKSADWIRKQPLAADISHPTVGIELGEGKTELVPTCLETGLGMHVSETESLAVLNSKPFTSLSPTLQAAITVNRVIGAFISPPDEMNVNIGVVDPQPGVEKPMVICVGKKP